MSEDKKNKESLSSNAKTSAILAWLFAPITSLVWMNDDDEFLSYHAKQSLSWSIVAIIGYFIFLVLGTILLAVFVGLLCYCLFFLWIVLDIVIRVMGMVKANNGEKWEVPVVGNLIK